MVDIHVCPVVDIFLALDISVYLYVVDIHVCPVVDIFLAQDIPVCNHLVDNRVCPVVDILFGAGYTGVSSLGGQPCLSGGGYPVLRWIYRCVIT